MRAQSQILAWLYAGEKAKATANTEPQPHCEQPTLRSRERDRLGVVMEFVYWSGCGRMKAQSQILAWLYADEKAKATANTERQPHCEQPTLRSRKRDRFGVLMEYACWSGCGRMRAQSQYWPGCTQVKKPKPDTEGQPHGEQPPLPRRERAGERGHAQRPQPDHAELARTGEGRLPAFPDNARLFWCRSEAGFCPAAPEMCGHCLSPTRNA